MLSVRSRKAPSPSKRNLRFFFWAPVATLLLMLVVEQTKFFERINLTTENLESGLRASLPIQPPPSEQLLLVGVGEGALKTFGAWPWPRSLHGNFLQLLSLAPPAVVAWDILFVDKGAEDEDLAKGVTIANAPVVTGALWQRNNRYQSKDKVPNLNLNLGLTQPLTHIKGDLKRLAPAEDFLLPVEPLRDKTWFGCVNAEPQADGVRHKIPMVLRYGNSLLPGLSLQILMRYWSLAPDQIQVHLGDAIYIDSPQVKRRIPIDEKGWYYINYRYELARSGINSDGKEETRRGFDAIDYALLMSQLLQSAKNNATPPPITGKILLVGQVAEGLSDLGPSPLAPNSPLVLVHMNALNNILQEDYLERISPSWIWLVWLIWLVLSVSTVAWLENRNFIISVLIPCCMIVAYTFFAIALFSSKSILLPITMPVLGFFLLNVGAIARRVIVEEQDKRRMRMAFTAYLAPNVLEKIIENRQNLKLGGERREVAVLFSDIRGFTSLSESVGEEALVTQLNEYLTDMVDCVNRYGGTLHKFIGDAILAVWGDTLSEGPKKDCTQALNAALAMRAELIKLNARWKSEKRNILKIGIGINRGHVIVGNIGAPQRMEFTVIGDTVNTASRLEGVTKQYRLDLVVSDSFAECVKDEFALQTLGLVRPPGKSFGVKIYHPMSANSEFSEDNQTWLAEYERAMDLYFEKKFSEALPIFEKCQKLKPENWPAEHHVERCHHYIAHPPDENWTGIRDVEK